MATHVQILRGTSAEIAGYAGLEGELTYATDTGYVYVHDGFTPGGRLISLQAITPPGSNAGVSFFMDFTGDGVATDYPLNAAPEAEQNVIVTVNGVVQTPVTAYTLIDDPQTVNGKSLRFAVAPANNARILAFGVNTNDAPEPIPPIILDGTNLDGRPPISPSLDSGVVPAMHMRRAAAAAARGETVRVAIMGDSLATAYTGTSLDTTGTIWGAIIEQMKEMNPGVTLEFHQFGWGSRTWTNANQTVQSVIDGGATPPLWAYGDGSLPWVNYVLAVNPHVVFVVFGMNDRENVSVERVQLCTDALKVATDPVILTPMVPHSSSTDTNISSEASQDGRLAQGLLIRSMCAENGWGMVDLQRHQLRVNGKVLDDGMLAGIDPRRTVMSTTSGFTATTIVPALTGPMTDQDFGVEIVASTGVFSTTRRFVLTTSRSLPNAKTRLEIYKSGANVAIDFFADGNDVADTPEKTVITTGIWPLSGNFDLRIFRRDIWTEIHMGSVTLFRGVAPSLGGRFAPTITFAAGTTGDMSVRWHTAKFVRNYPLIDDTEMWGDPLVNDNIEGGNNLNHPTYAGVAHAVRPAFERQDFNLPRIVQGSTANLGPSQRFSGIGRHDPQALLHIAKSLLAQAYTVSTAANNLVLEDETNVGMSLLTGNGGVIRIRGGAPSKVDAFEINWTAANGIATFRTNGVDKVRILELFQSGHTALQVAIDGEGGFQSVRVGANGTGPGGVGRALWVQNV